MQRIHPIREDTLRDYIGKPICAVMHDGSCYYGWVHAVHEGKLYVGQSKPEEGVATTRRGRHPKRQPLANRRKKGGAQTKATVSAFFPSYGSPVSPYGVIGLELALIALLFAIPLAGYPFF